MSGKLVGSIAAAAILAAGAGALILGGGKTTGGGDGGVVPVPEEVPVEESQLCQRAVRANNGRLVRLVGVAHQEDEVVVDTEVGRVVEVVGVPERALCHAVVDARPVAKSEFFTGGDGKTMEWVGNVPNVPELKDCYGKASWPVMISGSCLPGPVGSCMWSMLLRGECCKLVGSLQHFTGSTLKEFLALPPGIQRRFLRIRGKCIGDQGEEVGCSVPVGDPRAVAGSDVTVPHGFAGRVDLNYVRGEWDGPAGRHRPKPRYVMPQGVGGPP